MRITIDDKNDNDFRENGEDEEHDPNQFEVISTKPIYWITSTVHAQKLDVGHYGASMPVLPSFSNRDIDTRLIWITSAIISQNQCIWQSTCNIPMFTSK